MNYLQAYIKKSLSDYFLITNTLTGNKHVFNRYGAIMTVYKYGEHKNIAVIECNDCGGLL